MLNNKQVFKEGDKVYFLKKGMELSLNNIDRTAFPLNYVSSGTVISCNPNGYTGVRSYGQDYYILTMFVSASEEEVEKEAKELNKNTLGELREFLDIVEKDYL